MTDVAFLALSDSESSLAAQRNPYRVYIATLAPGSQKTMSGCLDRIARIYLKECGADPAAVDALTEPGDQFPWWRLEYQHTAKIAALLASQPTPWAPSYINKHLAALRQVLKHAWKLELIDAETYHRAIEVKDVRGHRLPAGRSLAATELAALLRVCAADETPAGRRDAALIAMLYSTGLRRHEVAKVRLEDYRPGERALRVIGKGGKEREVYLTEHAAEYLGAWLVESRLRTGPVFRAIHKSGAVWAARGDITPGAIGGILSKRRIEAGLPQFTSHDLRRTNIGDLLDAGVDLATVQQLAGHALTSTTAAYDRRPARTRRLAVDRLSMPALGEL